MRYFLCSISLHLAFIVQGHLKLNTIVSHRLQRLLYYSSVKAHFCRFKENSYIFFTFYQFIVCQINDSLVIATSVLNTTETQVLSLASLCISFFF